MENVAAAKPPRVLLLAPQPFYAERGTPINVRLICKVLGEAGYTVDLLHLPTGRDIRLTNVNRIRLPNLLKVRAIPIGPSRSKLFFDLLLILYALRYCLERRYRVIHGIEEGGFLAVLLAKCFRTVSVYDMDSSISEQLRYSRFIKNPFILKAVARVEKWAIRHSTLVLTVCASLSDKAARMVPGARIMQIEDIPIYDGRPVEVIQDAGRRLREKHQLDQRPLVLYTGNLQPYQGIDLLLEAWRWCRDQAPENGFPVLVVVGGPIERVAHYEQMARRLNLAGDVRFTGQRPSGEMFPWMAASDLLVSPRKDGDNTPLKIYSYMYAGKPIVATRMKTHTQVLTDAVAFLADPWPAAFGRAILTALKDPELARRKGEAARATVEEHFSFAAFRRKLLIAYRSIESLPA